MKQDLWSIIEEIEAVIAEGMHIPLSDRVVISEHEIFALLDELRATLPEELTQAKNVMEERDRILEQARSDAERVVEEAQEYADKLTAESEITERAEEEAAEVLAEADEKSERIMIEAHKYADDVLEQLQNIMERATSRVTESRKELRTFKSRSEMDEAAAGSDESPTSSINKQRRRD